VKKLYIAIILWSLVSPNIVADIVAIDDSKDAGTSVSFSFEGSKGNAERSFYSISARLPIKEKHFLILKKSQRKKDQELIDESTFIHSRFYFGKKELFFQHSKNPFRRYKQRDIVGAGYYTRFAKVLGGIGLLAENEEDLFSLRETKVRGNFYLSVGEKKIKNTTYFQPASFSDYKVSSITSFTFLSDEKKEVKFTYSVNYDSQPPFSAKTKDTAFATVFTLKL
jgi:hypothetical protein|tara:strand:+ start:72 stop:743 length:672 start_codon:yes stop_codon:yes gene_type:complete